MTLQIILSCHKCGYVTITDLKIDPDPQMAYCGNCSFILFQIKDEKAVSE